MSGEYQPLDTVKVHGVQVHCNKIKINEIFGCTYRYQYDVKEMIYLKTLDNIKAWLSKLNGILAPSWFEKGAIIEKTKMHIHARLWFGFINRNIMSS